MKKEIKPSRIEGSIDAPASKSYAQRALAAALLADGWSVLRGMSLCDDTDAALDTVKRLGAEIEEDGRVCRIKGGLNPSGDTLDIGESGLSTRLFTPIAALCDRKLTITGHGSILTRPISMMEEPLAELGASVKSNDGFLPVEVKGPLKGGEARLDGSVSSQFLTGLLMALPVAGADSKLYVGNLKSKPYIDMTIEVAKAFGIEITHNAYMEFNIKGGQKYIPSEYAIEGDWSGASCLLVAGAVAGKITVNNLNGDSMQADIAIIDALKRAGAVVSWDTGSYTVSKGELKAFEFNATDCPDLFPALVALAANCQGHTTIAGTNRLAHKESDRAMTLAQEFGKLGIEVDISKDNIMIINGGAIHGGIVSSHNDHRIAMAAAVAALTADAPVSISGAEAVNKSYPCFWDDLTSVMADK